MFGKLAFFLLGKDELYVIASSLSLRLFLVVSFCKGGMGAFFSLDHRSLNLQSVEMSVKDLA